MVKSTRVLMFWG